MEGGKYLVGGKYLEGDGYQGVLDTWKMASTWKVVERICSDSCSHCSRCVMYCALSFFSFVRLAIGKLRHTM